MTTQVARPMTRSDADLLAAAERLTLEYADLPAGSVLRCYARATFVVRRRRSRRVPHDAEKLARRWLAARRTRGLVH